jgi:hypothetical protein
VECGLIQGFPHDYPWQGGEKDKITQIGNAVPPPLAYVVASQILPRITFHAEPQSTQVEDKKGKKGAAAEESDEEEDDE